MNIKFCLRKQKLQRIDSEEIAGFGRNHIYATFIFDKIWKNLEKYAIFTSAEKKKYIVKLGYGKELSCNIPEEVLKFAYFKVSIFADELLTSTQETILLSPSGYVTDIDTMNSDDIIDASIKNYLKVTRKKHFDEDIYVRLNKFEILEHPYQ